MYARDIAQFLKLLFISFFYRFYQLLVRTSADIAVQIKFTKMLCAFEWYIFLCQGLQFSCALLNKIILVNKNCKKQGRQTTSKKDL